MNFKKKRRFRDVLRTVLIFITCFTIPSWLVMYICITGNGLAGIALLIWIHAFYNIIWRDELEG